MKEKVNVKRLLVLIGVVATTAVIIGGATLWAVREGYRVNKPETAEKEVIDTPRGFREIVVNGVKVNIPISWGDFEFRKIEPQFDYSPYIHGLFSGYDATTKDEVIRVSVYDFNSINNALASGNEEIIKPASLKKKVLEETYNERAFKPELFHELWFNMRVGARKDHYNHRYIESSNGDWRGFWYVFSIHGQSDIQNLFLSSTMYNKEQGKVLEVFFNAETSKIKELNRRIIGLDPSDDSFVLEQEMIMHEGDAYVKTAYMKDEEVRNIIDNEFLVVLRNLR